MVLYFLCFVYASIFCSDIYKMLHFIIYINKTRHFSLKEKLIHLENYLKKKWLKRGGEEIENFT